MKLLLLLTAAFPYDSGEEFLSTEVNYIRGFDQVLVCPCNLKADSVVTKPLPEGVTCCPLKKTEVGKSLYAKLLFQPYVLDEIKSLLADRQMLAGRMHEMLFFLKNAYALYGALKTMPELKNTDDVTIYSYWFYDAAAAGALLKADLQKQGVNVKLISRAHGFDVNSERAKYNYLPMRRFLLRRLDRLAPCSQNGADTILHAYPGFAQKIKPALLGTSDHGAHGGCREPELHLVSCSYMVPVKRLHLIVQALMLADFPIRWTHIGAGPLQEEIRRLAEKLPPHVTAEFLGQMDNAAIMEYYGTHAVSALANVSSSEGIPVSVMEAASFGFPVIATDVGGTSEAVRHSENGFLLNADFQPAELMQKIRQLKELPQPEYDSLCRNSRSLWEEKFNAAKNYTKFYEEIVR